MAITRRLERLMERLTLDWHKGDQNQRSRSVTEQDAVAIARELHEQMDRGTAARAAYAETNALHIACEAGCSYCCENIIFVFQAEAITVADWLSRAENHEMRAHFMTSYPAWRTAVGDIPERAAQAQAIGRRADFERAMQDVWSARIMCAFNREGACTVYPVRPNSCRTCHALDSNESCIASSEVAPQALQFPPIDDFLRSIRPLTESLHVSLGRQARISVALCDAVFQLLDSQPQETRSAAPTQTKIRRNGPCPCGSGEKYKRCCGE